MKRQPQPVAGQRKQNPKGWPKAVLAWALVPLGYSGFAFCVTQATSRMVDEETLTLPRQLIQDGKFKAAEDSLNTYLAKVPRSGPAHSLLAYTLFREGQPERSLAEYTAAATFQAPSAEDLRYVGLDYVLLKDFADAGKWLNESIALDRGSADTWYDLGRVHYEEGQYQKAVECFETALKLAPRSVKAENNLGLALEGVSRKPEAVAAYRRAIALQQQSKHPSEQPLLNLAMVLLHDGDLDNAQSLLTQAVTIAPGDAKVHERLGQLYLQTQQLDKARAELESGAALAPNSAPIHYLLGQVYRRQGLSDKAKQEFSRSAALSGTKATPNHE